MAARDPLQLLTRPDKWFLGGGNRLLYAPPFPLHRGSPGLWDTAHYYNYPVQTLFSYALLDERGVEIPLTIADASWRPDRWRRRFHAKTHGLTVTEDACVLPFDVAVCTVNIRNNSGNKRSLRLVAWSAPEHQPGKTAWIDAPAASKYSVRWTSHVHPEGRAELKTGCAFGCGGPGVRISGRASEGKAPLPSWAHTPFYEQSRRGPLPAGIEIGGVTPDGIVWLALERRLSLPARGTVRSHIGFAMAPTAEEAESALRLALRRKDPVELSTTAWSDYFAGVPRFHSSDPWLTAAYWHRWYGLRLNTIYGGEGNYEYPAVCEGIGYFRAPISYSAPCHMMENRWLAEPELAQGSLLTFIRNQRKDGGFRGYIDVNTYRQEMFYHANWGRALTALDAVHPSKTFLELTYDGLRSYASYFDRERDEEVSGLYDIDNHYETGQEYMHRYTAVDPTADRDNWGEVFRLKGVDVTVYVYELKRALARSARTLGKNDDAELWDMEAGRTRDAIRTRMWDPQVGMFFDVDPRSGKRTGVKAATCFYPYFTDIVTEEHVAGLKKHLLSPKEFWTPWPAPSTSVDDPTFSAEPHWKGKRMNCPWNGRVWPMTNSHVMEALAASAFRFGDAGLEKKAGEFLQKFIRMMFFDQDPKRPNCFEHYNPFTGQASEYRGVDDYMHSWVNDLIIRFVMGVQPNDSSVIVRPLRMGVASVEIDHLQVRGHQIKVHVGRSTFEVWVDGVTAGKQRLGRSISLDI